jgi:hypothetical protein
MGGGEIDLRDARFSEPEVTINIFAMMGGCEVIVPEDATVRVTGIGIMGAFDHSNAGSGTPGGPVITVRGVAIMGGVEVSRRPSAQAMRDARQQRIEDRQQRHEERRALMEERIQARVERHGERRDARGYGDR